jgi:hypothetical protein
MNLQIGNIVKNTETDSYYIIAYVPDGFIAINLFTGARYNNPIQTTSSLSISVEDIFTDEKHQIVFLLNKLDKKND